MDGIRQWQGYDELDMVYVLYFGDFLSIGSRESFEQNILFRLSPPRKAARPAGKACRPGPAWPLKNTVGSFKY
jgi:hypothetical protein